MSEIRIRKTIGYTEEKSDRFWSNFKSYKGEIMENGIGIIITINHNQYSVPGMFFDKSVDSSKITKYFVYIRNKKGYVQIVQDIYNRIDSFALPDDWSLLRMMQTGLHYSTPSIIQKEWVVKNIEAIEQCLTIESSLEAKAYFQNRIEMLTCANMDHVPVIDYKKKLKSNQMTKDDMFFSVEETDEFLNHIRETQKEATKSSIENVDKNIAKIEEKLNSLNKKFEPKVNTGGTLPKGFGSFKKKKEQIVKPNMLQTILLKIGIAKTKIGK